MKNIVKGTILAALGLALAATPALAQKPKVEFSAQFIGLNISNPDGSGNNSTNFLLGSGSFSSGFYVNEMIAIEPTLLYGYTKDEGASDANTALGLDIAVPIYLSRGYGRSGGLFIAPYVGYTRFSSGGSSASQNHFGANLGTKIKVMDCLYWRGQVGAEMGLENKTDGLPKYTDINASFGISVYLH